MFGVGVIEGLKKWIEVSYQAIDFLFHTWSLYVTKFSSQITWFRQAAIIYFFRQCVNNETYSYNPVTLINNKTWNLQGDIELN